MSRRVLIAVVVVLALVVGALGVIFVFGTPVRQVGPAATPAPAAQQAVPAPDPSAPLAIEIPGCVCHSDDPKLVAEHESYRMNQCAGCHAGAVPTGQ